MTIQVHKSYQERGLEDHFIERPIKCHLNGKTLRLLKVTDTHPDIKAIVVFPDIIVSDYSLFLKLGRLSEIKQLIPKIETPEGSEYIIYHYQHLSDEEFQKKVVVIKQLNECSQSISQFDQQQMALSTQEKEAQQKLQEAEKELEQIQKKLVAVRARKALQTNAVTAVKNAMAAGGYLASNKEGSCILS